MPDRWGRKNPHVRKLSKIVSACIPSPQPATPTFTSSTPAFRVQTPSKLSNKVKRPEVLPSSGAIIFFLCAVRRELHLSCAWWVVEGVSKSILFCSSIEGETLTPCLWTPEKNITTINQLKTNKHSHSTLIYFYKEHFFRGE